MTALDLFLPHPSETGEWPAELGSHLSSTRISMFQRCPEQYRRRYILGEKERPGAALVWGGADHEAHEVNFRQKIGSGVDLPVADVEVAFAEAFDRRVDEMGDDVQWGTEKPGELKDAGVLLVGAYHRQVSPSVQPTAVEREFSLEIPGVPVPVIGRMDVETALPAIERKTARAAVRKVKPTWRIQGLLYQLVEQRPVVWHVSVKTKTPAVYTPEEAPGLSLAVAESTMAATERLVATTAATMVAYWETFGPDRPWPGAITHDWACDFCGFRPSCPWWGN